MARREGFERLGFVRTAPPRRAVSLAFLWALVFSGVSPAPAAEPDVALSSGPVRPHTLALRVERPPVVDGRLDEAAWAQAPVIRDLRVSEPIEGAPLSEPTEIRIVYDEDGVYFGFSCFDREPGAVIASALRRDASQRTDDRVLIMLDTFNERRSGYAFSVNPNGARWDALLEEGGGLSQEWDGIWYAAATRTDEGWFAEVGIPMKTLNFPEEGRTWGLNLARGIARQNQLARWAFPLRNVFAFDTSHFGDLDGLDGLEQGLGLDVIPSLALRQIRIPPEGRVVHEGDPTLDVFYKITPSLTNAVTVNTDFSEAEPDKRQANLTRFALFFPEQRDFFLQDSGIFRFADFGFRGGPDGPRRPKVNGQPFFSRRVGIETSGDPLSIRFGEKLAGRVGRVNVGLLSTRIEGYSSIAEDELGRPLSRFSVDGKWLSVARVSANVLEESTVGGIMTYGDPSSDEHNKLFGADFNYRTSRLFGDKILSGSAWAERTSSTGVDDRQNAFGASLQYPNDRWNWLVEAMELQRNFRPALGFANRTAIRDYSSRLRHRWRPSTFLRSVDTAALVHVVTGTDNDLQSLRVGVDLINFQTDIGDFGGLFANYRREDLLADFEIRPGIVIPKENYRFDEYGLFFSSSRNRPANVRLELRYGQFYTGTRFDTEASVLWRPSSHAELGVEYEQFQVRLAEGAFTSRIVRVKLDFALTSAVSWTNLVQWDNETDEVTVNSRMRWIVEPGRELILVLDPFFQRDDRFRLRSTTTEMVAKLVWTQRY